MDTSVTEPAVFLYLPGRWQAGGIPKQYPEEPNRIGRNKSNGCLTLNILPLKKLFWLWTM
jgi:hypothetical protein